MPRAKPPAGHLEPHIEDALAELRAAERAVDTSLGPLPEGGRSAPVPSATVRPAWPTAAPPASSARPALTASAAPAVGPELLDDSLIDRCVTACNALQSMRRSAKLLCELTGPGDARCSSAADRVGIARGKVRASCGACAD